MSILDALVSPGATLGCIAGVGAAACLHWLFPEQDLVLVQALLVVVGGVIGVVVETNISNQNGLK